MKILNYPSDKKEIDDIIENRTFTVDNKIEDNVAEIVSDVRNNGDKALFKYTARYDKIQLKDLRVSETEIDTAYDSVDSEFLSALDKAMDNISTFHKKQLRESWFTNKGQNMVGQLINPLKRVGAYVPGGRAAYPSSVLMTCIPALVAGVEEIAVVTPPDQEGNVNPYTLAAARVVGVDEIYKAGGAQAIAALAWGTETITAVDKIVGPGNIYVTTAKKIVYGQVDIDMLAGPSEVLILSDETADPSCLAADLLSQAEHDPLAVPMLITDDKETARTTIKEVEKQLQKLSREEIARESWDNQGLVITVDTIDKGIELVNKIAPEHFELNVKDPFSLIGLIKNAGAVFVGEGSPEPLGDYMAGPNHVLPTGGTARFASPLNTDDFIKKSSLIYYQKEGLREVESDIRKLAALEGLDGHAAAVKIRFKE